MTINILSERRRSRSFIPGDYCRQHTRDGRVQDGQGGGLTQRGAEEGDQGEGGRDSLSAGWRNVMMVRMLKSENSLEEVFC